MTDRTTAERLALFALGATAVALVGAFPGRGFAPPIAALVVLAVVAGLVEAAAVRRTGRHHWVLAWLPAALGMIAVTAFAVVTGPQGPDSGVALSIVVAAFAVAIPVFAVAVLLVGWGALRIRPPAPPPTPPPAT